MSKKYCLCNGLPLVTLMGMYGLSSGRLANSSYRALTVTSWKWPGLMGFTCFMGMNFLVPRRTSLSHS